MCTIHIFLTLSRPPFMASNQLALARKIRKGVFKKITSSYSADLSSIINSMLSVSVKKRSKVKHLLANPHMMLKLKERKLNQQ